MPKHPHARDAAQKFAQHAIEESRKLLIRAFDKYSPPKRAREILESATVGLGVVDHAPLCNFQVRRKATGELINVLLEHYDRVRHDPDIRHFFLTATFDDGITNEIAPAVDFAAIKLKVRRMLIELKLDAMCVFELDVLARKLPNDGTRLLLFHVHAVCWTRDPTFQPVAVSNTQSDLAKFRNRLGVPSIKFVSRKMSARTAKPSDSDNLPDPRFAKLGRNQIARSIAHLGYYMLKAPFRAKDRKRQPDGTHRVRYDRGAFRLKTAIRFAEIWSQITPSDAVFGVGREGGPLSREFSKRMRCRARPNGSSRERPLKRNEVVGAWKRFFEEHAALSWKPSKIRHRAS